MSELKVRAGLEGIPAYKPGKPAGQHAEPGAALLGYKLSSNENPYPPLSSVRAAINQRLVSLNRYPDMAAPEIRERLADIHGVQVENIAIGTGSVEVVSQLIRATAGAGDEVLFAWRSFEAYPLLVLSAGAAPVMVPLTADESHDLDAMAAAVTENTRLVIVCNPNNPTGAAITTAELNAFIAKIPHDVTVAVDEAYLHFNDADHAASGIEMFKRYGNVVVLHTFSKAYGLAGMRIGYAIAPVGLASALRKMAIPFGVTALAQHAALASLEAEDELQERVDSLVAERGRVESTLRSQGWRMPRSYGNFIWFRLGEKTLDAVAVFERNGVSVRPFAGEGLRVTIGEPLANDVIIATASELMAAGFNAAM